MENEIMTVILIIIILIGLISIRIFNCKDSGADERA